jgi:hypothetical protein
VPVRTNSRSAGNGLTATSAIAASRPVEQAIARVPVRNRALGVTDKTRTEASRAALRAVQDWQPMSDLSQDQLDELNFLTNYGQVPVARGADGSYVPVGRDIQGRGQAPAGAIAGRRSSTPSYRPDHQIGIFNFDVDTRGANNDWTAVAPTGNPIGRTTTSSPAPAPTDFMSWLSGQFYNPNAGDQNLNEHANLIARGVPGANQGSRLARMGAPALPGLGTVADWTEVNTVGDLGTNIVANALTAGAGSVIGKLATRAADKALVQTVAQGLEKKGMAELAAMVRRGEVGVTKPELKAAQESLDRFRANPGARSLNTVGYEKGRTVGRAVSQADVDAIDMVRGDSRGTKVAELDLLAGRSQRAKAGAAATSAITTPQEASWVFDPVKYNMVRGDNEQAQKRSIELAFQREANAYARTQATRIHPENSPNWVNTYRQAYNHFYQTRAPQFLEGQAAMDALTNRGMQAGKEAVPRGLILPGERPQIVLNPSRADFRTLSHETGHAVDLGLDRVDYTDPASIAAAENRADSWADQVARRDRRFSGNAPQPLPQGPSPITNAGAFEQDVSDPHQRLIRNFVYDGLSGRANLSEAIGRRTNVIHETSPKSAASLATRALSVNGGQRFWVSDAPDLALGQGGKGVRLHFDSDMVNGFKPKNFANGVLQDGGEYVVDKSATDALRTLEFKSEKQLQAFRRIQGMEGRFDFNAPRKTEYGWAVDRKRAALFEQDQPLAKRSEQLAQDPKFQQWFSGSKVVDDSGLPKPLFHGTQAKPFDQFDRTSGGDMVNDDGYLGEGYYFTDDNRISDNFAFRGASSQTTKGGRTIPAYLSMKNPLVLDNTKPSYMGISEWRRALDMLGVPVENAKGDFFEFPDEAIQAFGSQQFSKRLRESGHDGVIYRGFLGDEYMVLDPTQIKGAFNQDFNPSDPRFMFEPDQHPYEVSTRVVKGKAPLVDPQGFHTTSMSDVGLDPAYEAKLLKQMRLGDPSLASATSLKDVVSMLGENLMHLHEHSNPSVRALGKLWYDGGNAIANRWAERYGKSPAQMAAIIAVHSPETPWFMNVSKAERTADILANHADHLWDPEMTKVASTKMASLYSPEEIAYMAGKALNELPTSDWKAKWLRAYDEAHLPRQFRSVTPDGKFGDFETTGKGELAKVAWKNFDHIAKAIDVWEDGTAANISNRLGFGHKVRNFYNNILVPNSVFGHYTSDTHNAAAAHLFPYSSSDKLVTDMLGGTPTHDNLGYAGTYTVYHQAGLDVAKQLGIHPRELQSITWETIRSLFSGKSPKLKADIAAIWQEVIDGKISRAQAWNRILERSGGISDPDWLPSFRSSSEGRSSYLEGELYPSGRDGGAIRAGDGNGNTPNASGFEPVSGRSSGVLKLPEKSILFETDEPNGLFGQSEAYKKAEADATARIAAAKAEREAARSAKEEIGRQYPNRKLYPTSGFEMPDQTRFVGADQDRSPVSWGRGWDGDQSVNATAAQMRGELSWPAFKQWLGPQFDGLTQWDLDEVLPYVDHHVGKNFDAVRYYDPARLYGAQDNGEMAQELLNRAAMNREARAKGLALKRFIATMEGDPIPTHLKRMLNKAGKLDYDQDPVSRLNAVERYLEASGHNTDEIYRSAPSTKGKASDFLFEPDEPTLQGWVVAGEAAIKSGKTKYGAWAGAMKKAGLTAAEIKQYGKPLFELVNRNVQEGVPRSVSDRLATGQDVNPRGLGFGQAAKRLLYDDRTYLDEATRMLERVNEQPRGALEGSPIDINAAWRKAARAGNLAGAYVENGILGDASTGYAPLTKGLPEIESMLDQAGIPSEDWQRYRRAMRQMELDMRAGGGQGYDALYDKYRPLGSDPQGADQVHQAEVAGFLSKYGAKVGPIDQAFDDYTNAQLQLLERYGLKPDGYADDMRLNNQNYFPLHAADTYMTRAMGDLSGGDGNIGLDSDLIPAVGNRQSQDGFASMARQTESWVREGERNQAFLPFLDEASNSSLLDWMVREITDDPSALQANGIRRPVGEANIKGKDLEFDPEKKSGIITVYDQGKPRHFQVDPRLYSALKGSNQSTNNFTKFMTWLASLQRNLTTQRNPLFSWFFNPMIDVSAAVINHGMNPLQFFKGYATTFRGMNDPIYRAWVANLGQSSGLSARDYVEDRLKYAGMKKLPNGMPHRVLKWADDWILRGGPIEEATRVGFFRQVRHSLIKQGMPVEEAERIAAARSVELMDFGRASTLGRAMTRYGAVYGNIPAQSMRSLAVGFKKNPTAFVARASMLLVAPKILEYQTYKDDPDYMDQPDGWKDMGFHFKAGDQWITIPVDQLHQSIILGNTRRALQWSDGQGPGPEKTAADLAMAVGYPMVKPAAMTPLSNILVNTFQKHNNEAMMDLTFGRSVGGKLGDDPTPEQIAKRDAAYWQLMAQSNFGTLGKLGAQAYFHQQGLAKAPNPLARFTIDMARGNSPTPDPTGIDRILEGTMPGDPNTDIDRILRETLGPQY